MIGKHYVTTLKGRLRLRRHVVTRVETKPLPGRVNRLSSVRVRYVTVSRHLTRAAAERAAHEGNRKAGHTA